MTHRFKVVIAIDFGTFGTGVAWTVPQSSTEDVYPATEWNEKELSRKVIGYKTKTSILLKDNRSNANSGSDFETIAYGDEAHYQFLANQLVHETDRHKNWKLFEYFKMNLYSGVCVYVL